MNDIATTGSSAAYRTSGAPVALLSCMPQQWWSEPWQKQGPEIRLMLAILDDAFQCFRKFPAAQSKAQKRIFREAALWFFEPSLGDRWPFSFEAICDVVGLNPNAVRAALLRLPEIDGAMLDDYGVVADSLARGAAPAALRRT